MESFSDYIFPIDWPPGSISNAIDDTEYKCKDGSAPEIRNKVISGVVGASSSVTSIQVANLLRLFKIPQVSPLTRFSIQQTRPLHRNQTDNENCTHFFRRRSAGFFLSALYVSLFAWEFGT
jgi:hypothetical protein